MRLRDHREVRARRQSTRWRFAAAGGVLTLMIGAACLAPLAPAALAPHVSGPSTASAAAPVAPAASGAGAAAVPVVPTAIVFKPTPTPAPTLAVPTPVVAPTLTTGGLSVLASIQSDRAAQWVRNTMETPLRSGPNLNASVFTTLPQWTLLKQIGSQPDWLLVLYSGDGDTREAGPGWVKASDVGGVDPPTVWLTASRTGALWSAADASAKHLEDLPSSTLMEVIGTDYIHGTRVHVRLPGDGRSVPPSEGWIDGDSVARTGTPSFRDLPRAYPADLRADVRINVPYRTQLDGSDFAEANCGPTVLGMALESFGLNEPATDLRGQVLSSENFSSDDSDAGSYIWALADVARGYGLQPRGLYDGDGTLHHWSIDDIRNSVRNGQPVIVQVVYRGLPGREDSQYYGDHYVIITGLVGDQFLYNDPIGGRVANESPGYDRVMTAAELQRAMHASDTEYAFSAFSLAKN
ncbi:MAG: C39 family peptidase [Chloroflexi bacterium]|nr:C39 family peptidase [Chloroflexota bacterium]MBV9598048.1 C39 family peptidase [Chloroflexota bacterium]